MNIFDELTCNTNVPRLSTRRYILQFGKKNNDTKIYFFHIKSFSIRL